MLLNALFLTRNEQVSGSSPLVGSLFCCDLQVKHKRQEEALDELGGFVLQPTTATRPLSPGPRPLAGGESHGPSCTFLSSAWADRRFPVEAILRFGKDKSRSELENHGERKTTLI